MIIRNLTSAFAIWLSGIYLLFIPNIIIIDSSITTSTYDLQRLFEILLLCSTSGFLLFHNNSRKWWLNYFAGFSATSKFLLASFFLLGFLSAIFVAPLPKYALQELSLFALLFVLAINIAAQIQQNSNKLRMVLLTAIFITVAIISWQFVLEYFFSLLDGSITIKNNNFFWRFLNLRLFNQFQTWTLPFLALPFLLYYKKTGHWRILLLLPATLWWTFWLHSGGRATGVATIIGVLVVWLIFRKKAFPFLMFLAGTLLLGVMLYLIMFLEFEKSSGATLIIDQASDGGLIRVATKAESQRMAMWLAALKMAWSNPWLGIGPQQYAFYHPIQNVAHPHNATLQVLAEWGGLAFICFFLLVLLGFISWIKNITQTVSDTTKNVDSYFFMALTASFVAAGVHAQLSGILVMPVSQVTGVIVIALMLSYSPQYPVEIANSRQSYQHLLLSLFIFAMGATLIWSIFPDIKRLEEDKTVFVESRYNDGIFHPRFWQQG
ncbi:MAG: O-antigen ligase family protein, partial [Magnetococcales bacterium]|nr:O-antigen ligase family protein [Magnetococcales bacterium]